MLNISKKLSVFFLFVIFFINTGIAATNLKTKEDNTNTIKQSKNTLENMSEKEVQYWLAKKMKFMEVDPQSPSEVMEEEGFGVLLAMCSGLTYFDTMGFLFILWADIIHFGRVAHDGSFIIHFGPSLHWEVMALKINGICLY